MSDAAKAMLEGVAATERDLQASLQRHKVMPINPMGEKFDPIQHEALFEAPGTGQPSGTVIEVVEIGYMMEERLLRPAKVGLAKD
jgi:molecular chaperone GrpE